MQRIRRYVAVASLFAVLGLTGNAVAARRENDGPSARDAQKQQKQQKAKPKGWIAKALDELENKFSFPPP